MHRQDASNSAAFPCPVVKKTTIDNDIIIKGYLNSASLATALVKLFSVIEAVSGTLGSHFWFQKANRR